MKILTYDEDGNLLAFYPLDSGKEGIEVGEWLVEKIMQNPLGYRVENGKIVETGYIPQEPNPKESFEDLQLEYNIDLDYRLSLLEMGLA